MQGTAILQQPNVTERLGHKTYSTVYLQVMKNFVFKTVITSVAVTLQRSVTLCVH